MAVPKLPDGVAPKWNSPASFDERNMENRYEQTYYSSEFKWQLHPPSEQLASRRPKAVQPWLERQVGTALANLGYAWQFKQSESL